MIQIYSNLEVADNWEGKELWESLVREGTERRSAQSLHIVTASVKDALPNTSVKKGDVVKAVVVRLRHDTQRPDGTIIRFDTNAAVLINPNKEPRGTRIFGPVPRELRDKGFMRIISLAPEVV